jgi:DNA mismatch repair protein MutS
MAASKTPVMLQHAAAKRAYPDSIVLFRLGDFYEMFGDDAVLCAKILDLTLTSRNKGKPDEVPMAGVPHHAAHGYIGRLLAAGHKVAICEQMADPATVKGIVPREVVRVLTPGTVTHSEHLEANRNNWLAAIDLGAEQTEAGTPAGELGLALVDVSTGEVGIAGLPNFSVALAELCRIAPRELLLNVADPTKDGSGASVLALLQQLLPDTAVRLTRSPTKPEIALELANLGSDAALAPPLAQRALLSLLRFMVECNPTQQFPVGRIRPWATQTTMGIDPVAQTHLELVRSMSGEKTGTLLWVLDVTCTALGARLLRRRLLAPLLDVSAVRRRLDQVEVLVIHASVRHKLRQTLDRVSDLERLSVRATLGEATPRDLGALRDGLLSAAQAVELLRAGLPPGLEGMLPLDGTDVVADLAQRLSQALVERPPAQAKEGSIFLAEYDSELRELDELRKHGTARIVALEQQLREKTEIASLKIRFTRVFGWYLEVSKSQLSRVPSQWRRKQTIAGGERYTLDELDELADRIASAEERHRARELALLKELVADVAAETTRVANLAAVIAELDCAAALAEVAHRYDYCRPLVDDGSALEIDDGRHPVVERLAPSGAFVANDTCLDLTAERLWIVTGPNMAGKSTYLRQTALIAMMAQMGSFVPAKRAHVGVVDQIFSRVGASDNLARGESTFMVEMRETAQILRHASKRSLVVLDEIGRGTSTFDGLAIAWAVIEYLDQTVQCRALFATHYHELTVHAEGNPHVANYSVTAREQGNDVVFLHRLIKGAASRSYGVAVARLAGLPQPVLARAQAILSSFESGGNGTAKTKRAQLGARDQIGLFDQPASLTGKEREVLDTLRAFDVEHSTPIEALQLLDQLKRRL